MPGNTPRSELERIYRLIQAEKLDDAVDALRPIVKEDPENEDAWWLLANAATDPAEAKDALTNVLRLNPQNTQAAKLVDQLQQAYPDLMGTPAGTTDLDWSPQDFEDVLRPATAAAKSDDPFGDDREPGFAAQGELSKANFPQPEFFPEKFGDVPLHEPTGTTGGTGAAGAAVGAGAKPAGASGEPPKVTTPDTTASGQPDDEPSRLIPILMGVMLLAVIVFGALYLLNRPSQEGGGTTTGTTAPTSVALASLPPSTTEASASPTALASAATVSATDVATQAATQVVDATPSVAPAVTGGAGTTAAATGSPETATAAIPEATMAATASVQGGTAIATETAPTTPLAPLALSLGAIAEPFKTSGLADASTSIEDTVLGQTLLLKFCSKPGIDLLRNTDRTRDQLATLAAPYAAEVAAIGVRITNCADATNTLFSKVVPIAVVKGYANKTVDVQKYRASWINP